EIGAGIQSAGETVLIRWEEALTYRVIGSGADEATLEAIAAYTERLSRVTGLEIRELGPGEGRPRLLIFVERLSVLSPLLRELRDRSRGREGMDRIIEFLANPVPLSPCYGQVSARDGRLDEALILIRAETAGRFRQTCIEEEIAQILGLINDDPAVRPSIFNDDQEFALLTAHDEALLRIHYDPRLRPGMTREAVRLRLDAIVREVAE
ncbi:MAG: DUF2927 domain-containing protein, partial [Pseudomonadota bacterium]